jgi:ATP-binding protein involved in chromosome partitioning
MSTHVCSACGHQEAIFSSGGANELCQRYDYKLLGQLPLDSRIGKDCEQGTPTAAMGTNELSITLIKTALLATVELSKKALNYAEKFPDIVVE